LVLLAPAAVAAATQAPRERYHYGGSSPDTGFDCSGLSIRRWTTESLKKQPVVVPTSQSSFPRASRRSRESGNHDLREETEDGGF
jgi:hypothetical protein